MYLAKNSNGCLFLHEQKPQRIQVAGKGYWQSAGAKMPITQSPFVGCDGKDHLTWEHEPVPVTLTSLPLPTCSYD